MPAINWDKLKQDAAETIKDIDTDKLTKSTYTLLGASLAVLDHPMDGIPAIVSKMAQEAQEHTPEHYVEDELNSAQDYHNKGLDWIAQDELTHAEYWIGQLPKNKQREYMAKYDELVENIGKPHKCDGCLDEFSEILAKYDDTRSAADRDAMRMTLKQQLSDIEKELVEMRHEVHDPEAVKMFVDFREELRLKL